MTTKLETTLSQLRLNDVSKHITDINLADCGLTEIPDEIYLPHIAPFVEFLNLGGNQISSLPLKFGALKNLRILFFAGNRFTTIPDILGELPNLSMLSFKENQISSVSETCLSPSICWLILTGNQITELPKSIGRCVGLRKCMLSLNQLTELPEEMSNCTELELIRLAGNRFTSLPPWLPNLPNLSWLAYAGNKMEYTDGYTDEAVIERKLVEVDWEDIRLHAKLGEGASGSVHAMNCSHFAEPVAIKLFKSGGTRCN